MLPELLHLEDNIKDTFLVYSVVSNVFLMYLSLFLFSLSNSFF